MMGLSLPLMFAFGCNVHITRVLNFNFSLSPPLSHGYNLKLSIFMTFYFLLLFQYSIKFHKYPKGKIRIESWSCADCIRLHQSTFRLFFFYFIDVWCEPTLYNGILIDHEYNKKKTTLKRSNKISDCNYVDKEFNIIKRYLPIQI